jgi:penicillin-binding protein 2
MMISQGGTGVGTSGPSVEKILEALFGIDMGRPDPNGTLPTALPAITSDGRLPDLPVMHTLPTPPPPTPSGTPGTKPDAHPAGAPPSGAVPTPTATGGPR